MTEKKTGSKELDWWHEQPTTVAGVGAKGGIASAFSGMNLLGIARGTKQSLAESKEEHEARVRRQRGGAVETGEDSIVGISKGLGSKYQRPLRKITVHTDAYCKTCKVTYTPGSRVDILDTKLSHVLICPECGSSLAAKGWPKP